MLWKQWSQEENYTENYEQQTYIGDVDRNSTPAQINMNIRTVRDILDQFNNQAQMIFIYQLTLVILISSVFQSKLGSTRVIITSVLQNMIMI